MEQLIENADFFHDDHAKLTNCTEKIDDWCKENKTKVTGPQLLSALQALSTKLMQGKCPKLNTKGWRQAVDIYNNLIQKVALVLIKDNKLRADDIQLAYYNLYLEWFQYGPSTVQLEIMGLMSNSRGTDMTNYLRKLTGKPRMKLMLAMMTPITKKEDTEDGDFYRAHRHNMDVLTCNAFDKSSLLEADTIKLWLDYAFHLYLEYPHVSDEGLNQILQEAKNSFNKVKDGWEDFSDEVSIKGLIEKVIVATKTSGFPKGETASRSLLEPVSLLCHKLIKTGHAEKYYDAMFDLLEAVSVCNGEKEKIIEIFKIVLDFFHCQKDENIKGRISFFKTVMPRFKALMENLPVDILEESKYCTVITRKLEKSYAGNKTLTADWITLIAPLFKRSCCNALNAANRIFTCEQRIQWKEHKDIAKEVFQSFTQVQLPVGPSNIIEEFVKDLESCMKHFFRGLKISRILKEYGEGLMFLSISILELKINTEDAFNLVETIGEHIEISVKENKDKVMEVMKRLHLLLQDDTMPWTDSWPLQRAVQDILNSILDPVNDGRIFDDMDIQIFTSMCHTCLTKDALRSDASFSSFLSIAMSILGKLMKWMKQTKRLGHAAELIPLLMSKLNDGDKSATIVSCSYLTQFAAGEAAIIAPHLEKLITIYLDKGDVIILMPINMIYPFNPAAMKTHFQAMFQLLLDPGKSKATRDMAEIFLSASKAQPELFTEHNMKDIVHMAKNDGRNQPMLLQIIQEVSKRKPERMIKLTDEIIDKEGWDPSLFPLLCGVLSPLAVYDKSQGNKFMDFFVDSVRSNPHDIAVMMTALNSVRLLGFKYPDIIKPRRDQIASLPVSDLGLQTLKQTILDMVDGKTPDNLQKQLEEQQAAFDDLWDVVEEVEVTVVAVRHDLDKQGQELNTVKVDFNEQGKSQGILQRQMEEQEATLGDMVEEVEVTGVAVRHDLDKQ